VVALVFFESGAEAPLIPSVRTEGGRSMCLCNRGRHGMTQSTTLYQGRSDRRISLPPRWFPRRQT